MNPVQAFIRNHYSDERLAQLLAHCQEGKFSYVSCCCLIGIPTAEHALRDAFADGGGYGHTTEARRTLEGAVDAENFLCGIPSDKERRAYLIPLIEAEIQYREKNHGESTAGDLVCMAVYSGGRSVPSCRHESRDEAMSCPMYRSHKSEQIGRYHGPNHFELSQVRA